MICQPTIFPLCFPIANIDALIFSYSFKLSPWSTHSHGRFVYVWGFTLVQVKLLLGKFLLQLQIENEVFYSAYNHTAFQLEHTKSYKLMYTLNNQHKSLLVKSRRLT